MKSKKLKSGWTLIELLMALMVSSIILAAVATFAAAISSANTGADEIQQKQARLRTAMVKLSEVIKYSKMVCYSSATDIAIWTEDKDNDIQIDSDEIVYIEKGESSNYIKITEFNYVAGTSITMSQIINGTAKSWLMTNAFKGQYTLIDNCSNVVFNFDETPPAAKIVSIKFDYPSLDKLSSYEINSKIICDSGYLLDSGDLVSSDDD